ncbi:MAG: hydroxymethylglutaryl-CoA reductase [Flavobacteriales bacterium]
MKKRIQGFSKLSKSAKVEWLLANYFSNPDEARGILALYRSTDEKLQQLHDDFAENTLTNFYMPFGVAPNFLIDGEIYVLPMVTEESSVVAAAAKTASYWRDRGGFRTRILGLKKVGQVHFIYRGGYDELKAFFDRIKGRFFKATASLTQNMRARGGGIIQLDLLDKSDLAPHYYQIFAQFDTVSAMGANFINSCLEELARTLKREIQRSNAFTADEKAIEIVMCIVSNYTPECLVRAEVCCPIAQLTDIFGLSPSEFTDKFQRAIELAQVDPYRAVTHNKGIMNGVDAVVIATGNDFRAVEAAAHAYASRDGQYRSLSQVDIRDGQFRFWLDLPVSVGTVGGLTSIHPLVKLALEMLGNPTAPDLMAIIAAAGLAQNFAAVRSLVTTGIQRGHMKLHLLNILNQVEAEPEERGFFIDYFKDKIVSHAAVIQELNRLRRLADDGFIRWFFVR